MLKNKSFIVRKQSPPLVLDVLKLSEPISEREALKSTLDIIPAKDEIVVQKRHRSIDNIRKYKALKPIKHYKREYTWQKPEYVAPHHMNDIKVNQFRRLEINRQKNLRYKMKVYKFKGWKKSKIKIKNTHPSEIVYNKLKHQSYIYDNKISKQLYNNKVPLKFQEAKYINSIVNRLCDKSRIIDDKLARSFENTRFTLNIKKKRKS